nr:hypothetical protein [Tanacetum cinerariifolium]
MRCILWGTFSLIADIKAIRILLAIAAFYEYEIWKMDVKADFLNSHLSEDAYMVQLERFMDPKHPKKVCTHQRFIYGLKQASKSYNKRFDEEIKIGEAVYIIGIKIIHDRSKRLIALSQSAYLEKILKKLRMDNSKKGYTPMMEKPDYIKSQGAKTPTEVQRMWRVPYTSAIGSIMYAVRCTRTDVVFAQNLCSVSSKIQKSTKQSTDAVSSIEAEYIVAAKASLEAVWIRKFIDGLGDVMPSNKRPMEMLCDNDMH